MSTDIETRAVLDALRARSVLFAEAACELHAITFIPTRAQLVKWDRLDITAIRIIMEAADELAALKAKLARAAEALRFYAADEPDSFAATVLKEIEL